MAKVPDFADPQEKLDDSGDLVLVKVQEDENGDEYFEDIANDDEYETIADLFIDRLQDDYDIEEE